MTAQPGWRPLRITPGTAGTEPSAAGLCRFLRRQQPLADLLTNAKAVVFTGFAVGPGEAGEVLDLLLPARLAYVRGNSPRTKVGHNVYTSTEYPARLTISLHNELSYTGVWPARLAFYCEQAPASGGATLVADGAAWLRALDAGVREAFAQGLRYTQNLHDGYGFGRSWQNTFETAERGQVELLLAADGASWTWTADGGLRITQVRPATIRHPVTGAEVWFNQADQWHPAALDTGTAAGLAELMPAEQLPQSVTFADGSPIPAGHVQQVRDQGMAQAVQVTWQAGDVLLIDNVLVAHGRQPFTGPRRVLVSMSG